MSVDLDKIQDSNLKRILKRSAGLMKKHEPEFIAGIRSQAINAKIELLLSQDEQYQKEKQELYKEFGGRLDKIKETHIAEYIKAGLL